VGAVARYLWRFESWPAPRSSLGAVLRRVVTSTDCVRGWLSPAGGGVIAAPLRPPLAANARLPGRRSAVSHPGALCPECSRLSLWSVAPPAERPGSTGWSGSRGPVRWIQDPVHHPRVRGVHVASVRPIVFSSQLAAAGGVTGGSPPPPADVHCRNSSGEPFEERRGARRARCEDRHGASHTVSRATAARARGEPPSVRRPARTGSRAEATGANVRTGQGFWANV